MNKYILPTVVSVGIYNAELVVKNRSVTRNRKTTMFEIELPICDGGITYIDDTIRPIKKNTVICAKPGQKRHTKLPFKCYYIHFIVNDGKLYELLLSLSNFIELKDPERLRNIFIKISEIYNDDFADNEILLYSLILELVHILKVNSYANKATKISNNNHVAIDETIKFINENLASNLNLNTLSLRVNFTPTYFHRLFKASTGKPLREYIEEQRIRKAINLMMASDMTLTQIAYECGFSSQSYFSFAFKRKMKLPPREYVENIQKKYED